MVYSILFTNKARKQFKKLDKLIKIRIKNSLKRIRIRPENYIKKLIGLPFFSLRVGKYRVIIDIDKGKLIIFVIDIAHRKNIYKNL